MENASVELQLQVGLPANCRFVSFSPKIMASETGIKRRRGEGKETCPETRVEMINR